MPPGVPPGVPQSTDRRPEAVGGERVRAGREPSRARTSLLDRLDELTRRLSRARSAPDVAQIIRDDPWLGVGAGFAAGAVLGLIRSRADRRTGTEVAALGAAIVAQTLRAAISSWLAGQLRRRAAHD